MAPRGASAKYIDEIISLIAGGMTGAEACASKPDYPNYRSLTEWAAKNGRMDDIRAAWRGREKSDHARMNTNKTFSEEHYDAALELLARNPHRSIRRSAKLLGVDLPQLGAIRARVSREPVFAERYRAALAGVRSVISRHTPSAPMPVYRSGLLRAALKAHPIWKAARKAVPYTENDEDVIQEIVLAVLSGELDENDISSRGNSFGYKRLKLGVFASLDAPTKIRNRESERGTLIDTIANDSGINFY